MKLSTLLLCSMLLLLSCGNSDANLPTAQGSLEGDINVNFPFTDYWYAGKGELTSYRLEQNQYGEKREGHAVFVFVTEPFSNKKQVKLDYPAQAAKGDEVPVLKLNALRKFTTGIYDYSLMSSVFTPIELDKYPQTLKVTCTAQDWCGHSFTQLNHEKGDYQVRQFSYFEAEGDENYTINDVLLEDEIWTRLRINPDALPVGNIDLLPGIFFSRLAHEKLKPMKARAKMQTKGEGTRQYVIEYLHLNRTLTIDFQSEFPYRILGWKEMNDRASSKATLNKTMLAPYWELNSGKHDYLRDSLGLK